DTLLGAIHAWEHASDPLLSDLCRRLRARVLFKTVEIFLPHGAREDDLPAERPQARGVARDIAAGAAFDPAAYVGLDVASDSPFEDDGSLAVVCPHGRSRAAAEVSLLLDRLRNVTVTRARVIFAPELRDAVRAALIH